jgi:hypothetical protein
MTSGDIFRDISADAYHATGGAQLSELSLSIIGKFYFKEPAAVTANRRCRPIPVRRQAITRKSAEDPGCCKRHDDREPR